MVGYWLWRLATARTRILSYQDGMFEAAHRELLELREQVRKAELAVAATRPHRSWARPKKRLATCRQR
jgi:hypothetical protein